MKRFIFLLFLFIVGCEPKITGTKFEITSVDLLIDARFNRELIIIKNKETKKHYLISGSGVILELK